MGKQSCSRITSKYKYADNKFLKFAISQANIEPFLVGGGRSKLNAEIMMKISILAPKNIQEQARIGTFFRHLDRLITLHQCNCNMATRPCEWSSGLRAIAWEQRKFEKIAIRSSAMAVW